MTTAIIGVGKLGGTVARHLIAGGESVAVAARDEARAKALADALGPNASAASVEDAIAEADTVVLALRLDDMRDVIAQQVDHMMRLVDDLLDLTRMGHEQCGR